MSEPKTAPRGPQWSNSYEAQLSDGDLHWLHAALLARSPSDKQIREKLPPWKSGPRTGQKVSLATLSNIRDRLELEEDFQANEQTVDSLLAAEKEANPDITQEELDRKGLKFFTLLSIRQRDAKTFARMQKIKATDRSWSLEREKFELLAAEKMLSKALREKADEINASSLSQADKIAAMRQAAFADVAALQASGSLEIPK